MQLYGVFEQTFTQSTDSGQPYLSTTATATVWPPQGPARSAGLFWDGRAAWKLRLSPDLPGLWRYQIRSSDPAMNGMAGHFAVEPSARRGGIMAMADYPYAFQYQDGTPCFFMGDTAWSYFIDDAAKKHDWQAAKHYVDVRALQGFNVVHAMLLHESGLENEGGRPFESFADEAINPAYFQEVDRRVVYLNEWGITAGIVLAFARSTNAGGGFDWLGFASLAARRRFAEYVAARYGAYNCYFIIAGEWQRGLTLEEYNELGAAIAAADPHRRLIGLHGWGDLGSEEFAGQPWAGFGDYQQIYTTPHQAVLSARRHRKPVVNSEYAYYLRDEDGDGVVDKPNSRNLQEIRDASWDIVMAGGYFITGFGSTYLGGQRNPGPFDVDAVINDDWEHNASIVAGFLRDRPFWKLQPHDELVSGSGTYYALAARGEQYVVYARNAAGPLTLSVGAHGGVGYRCQRFDPRTGRYTDLGVSTGDRIEFVPPDGSDWLFVAVVQCG